MIIRLIFVGAVMLASPAVAQQSQPQPQPAIEFTFKITGPEVDLIGKALGSQPFEVVAPLIQKLRQQIMEQQNLLKSLYLLLSHRKQNNGTRQILPRRK